MSHTRRLFHRDEDFSKVTELAVLSCLSQQAQEIIVIGRGVVIVSKFPSLWQLVAYPAVEAVEVYIEHTAH